jgi:broad specificity phosphatase PhoE
MEILIARHGDTVLPGRCRGSATDCELSPDGVAATKLNLDVMHNHGVNALVTSHMTRACVAGTMGKEEYGMTVTNDPGMNPIHAGDWEGMLWSDIKQRWPRELVQCDTNARDLQIPGGKESIESFEARVLCALETIINAHRARHKVIGIVGHGCAISVLLSVIEGKSPRLRDKRCPTGSMHWLKADNTNTLDIVQLDVLGLQHD